MINVFKDVLLAIEKNGLSEGHHLYITFNTKDPKINIPEWLKKKYLDEMTIVIQYEYWNFKVKKNSFDIDLSFDDIKTKLNIHFDSIISFADPYANFGLKLNNNKKKLVKEKNNLNNKNNIKDNVIDFKKFKKN